MANQNQNTNSIDFSVFRKDMLDKCKIKNAKKRFKADPENKNRKPTIHRFTN